MRSFFVIFEGNGFRDYAEFACVAAVRAFREAESSRVDEAIGADDRRVYDTLANEIS